MSVPFFVHLLSSYPILGENSDRFASDSPSLCLPLSFSFDLPLSMLNLPFATDRCQASSRKRPVPLSVRDHYHKESEVHPTKLTSPSRNELDPFLSFFDLCQRLLDTASTSTTQTVTLQTLFSSRLPSWRLHLLSPLPTTLAACPSCFDLCIYLPTLRQYLRQY